MSWGPGLSVLLGLLGLPSFRLVGAPFYYFGACSYYFGACIKDPDLWKLSTILIEDWAS